MKRKLVSRCCFPQKRHYRRSFAVSAYDDSRLSSNKQQVHQLFLNNARRVTNERHLVSLEGQNLRSLRYILDNLDVASASICEWNENTHRQHVNYHETLTEQYPDVRILPLQGNINTWLDHQILNGNVVFLDYMGSIWGNQNTGSKPLEGIDLVLRNASLKGYRELALGFTFCKRGKKPRNFTYPRGFKSDVSYKGNQLTIVNGLVGFLACMYGYAKNITEHLSYDNMVYVQYFFCK